VLGQPDFTTSTELSPSATSLGYPSGVFYDQAAKVLWVADTDNNRVLMYGKPSHYLSPTSKAAYDGWVLESTSTSGAGGSLSAKGNLIIGDDALNRQYVSILSFDTSTLPVGAVIHSVTLTIKKAGKTGTDPLISNALGSLTADIQDGPFGAPTLELTDFASSASANVIANFAPAATGWYQLVVPSADFTYINPSGPTQFRLHFTTGSNDNQKADYDTFYAGDAASAKRPVLTIEYSLP